MLQQLADQSMDQSLNQSYSVIYDDEQVIRDGVTYQRVQIDGFPDDQEEHLMDTSFNLYTMDFKFVANIAD